MSVEERFETQALHERAEALAKLNLTQHPANASTEGGSLEQCVYTCKSECDEGVILAAPVLLHSDLSRYASAYLTFMKDSWY